MSMDSVTKKLFTSDEFQHMEDAGIFPPDQRFELIRGEIIQMARPTGPHAGRVRKLTQLFVKAQDSAIVSVQNEMVIANLDPMSRPRPDIALLKPMPEFFGPFAPEPHDVLLLIEISDTTIRYDQDTKAALYAEAGIAEYWILNIPENVLEVYSNPVDGKYRRMEILKSGQSVSPLLLPDVLLAVADILN